MESGKYFYFGRQIWLSVLALVLKPSSFLAWLTGLFRSPAPKQATKFLKQGAATTSQGGRNFPIFFALIKPTIFLQFIFL
jgi:hypothetical protein